MISIRLKNVSAAQSSVPSERRVSLPGSPSFPASHHDALQGDARPSLCPALPAELLPLASTSLLFLVSCINASRLSAKQHHYRTTALLCLTHPAQYCRCYMDFIKQEVTCCGETHEGKPGFIPEHCGISPAAGRTHIHTRWLIPPCSTWARAGCIRWEPQKQRCWAGAS